MILYIYCRPVLPQTHPLTCELVTVPMGSLLLLFLLLLQQQAVSGRLLGLLGVVSSQFSSEILIQIGELAEVKEFWMRIRGNEKINGEEGRIPVEGKGCGAP